MVVLGWHTWQPWSVVVQLGQQLAGWPVDRSHIGRVSLWVRRCRTLRVQVVGSNCCSWRVRGGVRRIWRQIWICGGGLSGCCFVVKVPLLLPSCCRCCCMRGHCASQNREGWSQGVSCHDVLDVRVEAAGVSLVRSSGAATGSGPASVQNHAGGRTGLGSFVVTTSAKGKQN